MSAGVANEHKWRQLQRFVWTAVLSALPLLEACSGRSDSSPANIVGYNHTDQWIANFYVNEGGGSGVAPHKGGGGFYCCIGIPKQWTPGMAVTIRWTSWADENNQSNHERVVLVPEYERVGDFAVHFLRDGNVKVFVTNYALWHPDYPLKGEEAQLAPGRDSNGPWDP